MEFKKPEDLTRLSSHLSAGPAALDLGVRGPDCGRGRGEGRDLVSTRQTGPVRGTGMCTPAWPTPTRQWAQDFYKIINTIHTGKDIDLQISLTFTNK